MRFCSNIVASYHNKWVTYMLPSSLPLKSNFKKSTEEPWVAVWKDKVSAISTSHVNLPSSDHQKDRGRGSRQQPHDSSDGSSENLRNLERSEASASPGRRAWIFEHLGLKTSVNKALLQDRDPKVLDCERSSKCLKLRSSYLSLFDASMSSAGPSVLCL